MLDEQKFMPIKLNPVDYLNSTNLIKLLFMLRLPLQHPFQLEIVFFHYFKEVFNKPCFASFQIKRIM